MNSSNIYFDLISKSPSTKFVYTDTTVTDVSQTTVPREMQIQERVEVNVLSPNQPENNYDSIDNENQQATVAFVRNYFAVARDGVVKIDNNILDDYIDSVLQLGDANTIESDDTKHKEKLLDFVNGPNMQWYVRFNKMENKEVSKFVNDMTNFVEGFKRLLSFFLVSWIYETDIILVLDSEVINLRNPTESELKSVLTLFKKVIEQRTDYAITCVRRKTLKLMQMVRNFTTYSMYYICRNCITLFSSNISPRTVMV